ncbi:hypothetical protein Trydic_g10944 [Trypoxylus dichotomus]
MMDRGQHILAQLITAHDLWNRMPLGSLCIQHRFDRTRPKNLPTHSSNGEAAAGIAVTRQYSRANLQQNQSPYVVRFDARKSVARASREPY